MKPKGRPSRRPSSRRWKSTVFRNRLPRSPECPGPSGRTREKSWQGGAAAHSTVASRRGSLWSMSWTRSSSFSAKRSPRSRSHGILASATLVQSGSISHETARTGLPKCSAISQGAAPIPSNAESTMKGCRRSFVDSTLAFLGTGSGTGWSSAVWDSQPAPCCP